MAFGWMIRNWLQREATQRAQEAIVRAARSGADDDADDHQAEDLHCDVAILCGSSAEAGGVVDRLKDKVEIRGAELIARVGLLGERRVVVVESGEGPERAARATVALIAGHRPAWVISAGFAGALAPELARGDIILASSIALAEDPDAARLSIDVKLQPAAGLHVGRLVTADHPLRTSDEKRALGGRHDALAVDTQSYGVAAACRDAKIRLLAIHVIRDTLVDELPPDIQHLANQTTTPGRLGAAAGALFRKPSRAKDLWNLRETSLVASDRLAEFLESTITVLPSGRQ